MPAEPVFIDQYPNEAQSAQSKGADSGDKAGQGLRPGDWVPVECQNFYFPCAHAQRLASMCPEPGIKEKSDYQQINGIDKLLRCECRAGVERKQKKCRDK